MLTPERDFPEDIGLKDESIQIWTNIVFITTTTASGNKRKDQDTAVRQLSNMRQNLGDYLQRFNNAKDTYTLLGLTLPRK